MGEGERIILRPVSPDALRLGLLAMEMQRPIATTPAAITYSNIGPFKRIPRDRGPEVIAKAEAKRARKNARRLELAKHQENRNAK